MNRRSPLRTLRTLPALVVGMLLVSSACSSDEKAAAPSSAVVDSGTPASLAPLPSDTAAPASSDGEDGGGGDVASGGCVFEVAGDITRSVAAPDGPYAVNYGPWTPDGLGPTFFVISCTESGAGNSVSFAANQAPIEMTGGQTINLRGGTGLGGQDATDPVLVTLYLDGYLGWGLGGNGTLQIAEFDQQHIAGSFTLPIKDLAGGGTATVTGTFNLTNKDGV